MANVPFSALYDQILPYLPGAEKPIVDSQIRKVAREFLKRTTLVREAFVFDTTAGVSTYLLTPSFGQVSSILDVWVDTTVKLSPVPEHKRAPADAKKPDGWFTLIPHLLNLYPQPDAVYPITCNAVVTLNQTDTGIPEEVVNQHAEALAAGVLAAMFGMPGKPWTQAQSAKESGRIYSGVIKTLRGQLRDGGQPNQSTFQPIARFGA